MGDYSFYLAPSKIAGVGVFAAKDILKGTKLNLFSSQSKTISKSSKILKDPTKKWFIIRFCVEFENEYVCPLSFNKIDIGWYLNHSEEPNTYHKNYIYYASTDIKAHTEITTDYKLISPQEAENFQKNLKN